MLYIDGNLTQDEALEKLANAAITATEVLPYVLQYCGGKQECINKAIDERDTVVLAYLKAQKQSLTKTGPYFEDIAHKLEVATDKLKKEKQNIEDAAKAIALMAEVVKLASTLVLAFA